MIKVRAISVCIAVVFGSCLINPNTHAKDQSKGTTTKSPVRSTPVRDGVTKLKPNEPIATLTPNTTSDVFTLTSP
jgi:hypothetical protein